MEMPFGLTGGAVGGAAGAAGGMIFNAIAARKNRDFQERLSRNKYTYAVQDLKNAGLNPILAATGGMGSVPSGATASPSNPGNPVTDGYQAKIQHETAKNLSAQRKKTLKETSLLEQQKNLLMTQTLGQSLTNGKSALSLNMNDAMTRWKLGPGRPATERGWSSAGKPAAVGQIDWTIELLRNMGNRYNKIDRSTFHNPANGKFTGRPKTNGKD